MTDASRAESVDHQTLGMVNKLQLVKYLKGELNQGRLLRLAVVQVTSSVRVY